MRGRRGLYNYRARRLMRRDPFREVNGANSHYEIAPGALAFDLR